MTSLRQAAQILITLGLLNVSVAYITPSLLSSHTKKYSTVSLSQLWGTNQDSHPWERVNIDNDPLQQKQGYTDSVNRPGKRVTNGSTNWGPVNRDEPSRRTDPTKRPSPTPMFPRRSFSTNDPTTWDRVNIENDPLQVQRGYTQPGTHRPPMQRIPSADGQQQQQQRRRRRQSQCETTCYSLYGSMVSNRLESRIFSRTTSVYSS